MKKGLVFIPVIILFLLLLPKQVNAATLVETKDTITNSRPSASSPLSANASSGAGQVSVLNNGSRYLASDSAKLIRTSTGVLIDSAINIASQSSALTTVYFGDTLGAAGQNGTDVLMVPITALHTIQFTTVTTIPVSGKIILTFPTLSATDADNDASPSATTFQFNNLVSGTGGRDNIDVYDDSSEISTNVTITETEPGAGTAGIITLTLDGSTSIAASSVVKIYLGCTTSTSSSCSVHAPRLINPTKTAAAGTADTWKLSIETQDASSVSLDDTRVKIGTVESVTVYATVEPSITVIIAGLNNGDNFNTVSGCASETTNSGFNASATEVNLGILSNGLINRGGQTITVSTNGANGYSITATSSGRLINPGTGFWITDINGGNGLTANDTPAPATFGASGTPGFGIFPCGARVPTSSPDYDDESALAFSSGGKGTNPWNTGTGAFYATIASYTGGAISSDATAIRYAATISGTTPAGTYLTSFNYVATATF